MTNITRNEFKIENSYVIMYTTKGEQFLVDLDDFEKVNKYYWGKDNDGYFVHGFKINGKNKKIRLHRFIMNCPDNMVVDHIHGKESRFDNRKENLRLATVSENGMNRDLGKNNTSGVTGVTWHKQLKKWIVRIQVAGKRISLGTFNNLDNAIAVRKQAEEKYFGEWSYDNSQRV